MRHKTHTGSDGIPYIFTDALGDGCHGCAAFVTVAESTKICLELHKKFACGGGVWQVDVRKLKRRGEKPEFFNSDAPY